MGKNLFRNFIKRKKKTEPVVLEVVHVVRVTQRLATILPEHISLILTNYQDNPQDYLWSESIAGY